MPKKYKIDKIFLSCMICVFAGTIWGWKDKKTEACSIKVENSDEYIYPQNLISSVQSPTQVNKKIKKSSSIKDVSLTFYTNIIEEVALDDISEKNNRYRGVVPISALKVSSKILDKLVEGDILIFPLKGIMYEVYVHKTIKNMDESISIEGEITDEKDSIVTITKNNDIVFISISISEGSFEADLLGGEGYLYSADSIDQIWKDEGIQDVIVGK